MPEALLSARRVARRFGRRVVLEPIDLDLAAGEVVALGGPNGAGKSTLLAILAGALAPSERRRHDGRAGAGRLDAAAARALPPADAAREPRALRPPRRAGRAGRCGARSARGGRSRGGGTAGGHALGRERAAPEPRDRAARRAARPAPRRAHGLARRGPAAGGSGGSSTSLRAAGGAVLFATHNLEEARRTADRLLVLQDGRSVYAGPPGGYREESGMRRVALLLGKDIRTLGRMPALAARARRLPPRDRARRRARRALRGRAAARRARRRAGRAVGAARRRRDAIRRRAAARAGDRGRPRADVAGAGRARARNGPRRGGADRAARLHHEAARPAREPDARAAHDAAAGSGRASSRRCARSSTRRTSSCSRRTSTRTSPPSTSSCAGATARSGAPRSRCSASGGRARSSVRSSGRPTRRSPRVHAGSTPSWASCRGRSARSAPSCARPPTRSSCEQEQRGGRTWLLSAQVQGYALALAVAFVTVLLGAGALVAEREENVLGRLARGLVGLGQLVAREGRVRRARREPPSGSSWRSSSGSSSRLGDVSGGEPWLRLPLLLAASCSPRSRSGRSAC